MRSKILLDLFHIYAPSYKEKCIADFVTDFLKAHNIDFTRDSYDNIYVMNKKNAPLLCAHMDCVGKEESGNLVSFINLYKYKNDIICKGLGNVGGDDKCGVYMMLLSVIDKLDVNYIFSVGEEVSYQFGIKAIINSLKDNEVFKTVPYCLVLDRKNSGDLICLKNNYGSKEFDEAMGKIGEKYNFVSVSGGYSDTNTICKYMNGANLSCGYYNPHSKQEFFSIKEMFNTYHYVKDLVKNLKRDIKFDETLVPKEHNCSYYNGDYWSNKKKCYVSYQEWYKEFYDDTNIYGY